ncbi:hypothetical protein WJ437_08895 [Ignavigranum ruoffiae]|uniref:hypothetical protein n=1 Tax=Ignavigranum ruoffiae TaxID=89093 RepID=UPI002877D788|nr:hypothetical protein [Ignavigranum ruoffiae]
MSNVLDILASDKIQVIKQGDNTFIKYNLLKNGHEVNFEDETAVAKLIKNHQVVYETHVDLMGSLATFNINKTLPTGEYLLEIIVGDKHIFPSDRQASILITTSSENLLIEPIESYGIEQLKADILNQLGEQKGLTLKDLEGYVRKDEISVLEGPQGDPGPKGDTGEPGQDGRSVVSIEDKDGTGIATVTYSDDKTEELQLPRGPQGTMGPKGDNLTIESQSQDEAGNTTVKFSDGTSITIQRGLKGEEGPMGPIGKTGEPGPQGLQGPQGKGFSIKKTFKSVEAMDSSGLELNDFVMINTDDVEDPDNAKLYYWDGETFKYLADLSGAQGVAGPEGQQGPRGEQGPQGPIGPTGPEGPTGPSGLDGKSVTVESSQIQEDGNTKITFSDGKEAVIQRGPEGPRGLQGLRGENGEQGLPGKDGQSITVQVVTEPPSAPQDNVLYLVKGA